MDQESFKHHVSSAPLKNETRLIRFFQRVNSFFKKETSHEISLIGRIHELHRDAEATLAALTTLRQKLEVVIEPQVFTLLATIIDWNVKEISRIRKLSEEGKKTTDQVKSMQDCLEWIDNAKNILLLQNSECSSDSILKLVIQQWMREFYLCLDRDIQVLADYAEHSAESIALAKEKKIVFLEQLEHEVRKQIANLNSMKEVKQDLRLDSISKWRSEVDRQREKCFSAALHEIDLVVAQFKPQKNAEEHRDDLAEAIVNKLNELERQVDSLNENCQVLEEGDNKKKKAYKELLDTLEEHIHELNSDLNLPQEHTHRVEIVINALTNIRKSFFDLT